MDSRRTEGTASEKAWWKSAASPLLWMRVAERGLGGQAFAAAWAWDPVLVHCPGDANSRRCMDERFLEWQLHGVDEEATESAVGAQACGVDGGCSRSVASIAGSTGPAGSGAGGDGAAAESVGAWCSVRLGVWAWSSSTSKHSSTGVVERGAVCDGEPASWH
jgi:hypothetical protein